MPVVSPEYTQAFLGRDLGSDGRLVAGVKTTGVYCKPSCAALRPAPEDVYLFDTPADAESAGFRPCGECKPASASTRPASRCTSTTVERALRLIEDGILDRNNIDALCERLGIGARQLRRLFRKHLGTSPIQVARMRRADFARRLIETSGLSMTHVAEAAGFGSIRRFNAVMSEVFGCPPTALRKNPAPHGVGLELEIPLQGPFAWDALLASLEASSPPGVAQVVEDQYRRTAGYKNGFGEVSVGYDPDRPSLRVRVSHSLNAHFLDVVSSVRRLFDVEAAIDVIRGRLESDPLLGRVFARTSGLRVLGAFDRFETAVMTLLGQHICPDELTDLARRIVDKHGKRIETSDDGLTHLFPTPYALSTARLDAVGVPKRRAKSIQALAKAVHEGTLQLDGSPSLEEALRRCRAIPGIGSTTADYIAMRVYREPDAFPAQDLRLRAAASLGGEPISALELETRAEQWRPFRAYAATCLWELGSSDEHSRSLYSRGNAEAMRPPEPADQVA